MIVITELKEFKGIIIIINPATFLAIVKHERPSE